MNCKQVQDLLPEFVDRQLKQTFLAGVETHLKACSECETLLTIYRQNMQLLGSFPEVEPPPDLVEKIVRRTAKPAGFLALMERYLRLPAPVLLPAVSALLILLLGPAFLQMNTVPSRSANKYIHRAWSYSTRLYGKAEGMGQEIATFKNIFMLILDRRAEKVQEELENYRKQKNDQQSSQTSYITCDGNGSHQGAINHVLHES